MPASSTITLLPIACQRGFLPLNVFDIAALKTTLADSMFATHAASHDRATHAAHLSLKNRHTLSLFSYPSFSLQTMPLNNAPNTLTFLDVNLMGERTQQRYAELRIYVARALS